MKQGKSYWLGHVAAANDSRLSLAQNARDNGVPLKMLYVWRSKFKAQSLPEAAVSANKARGDTQRFIAVSVARALPTNSIATTAAQPRCRLILAPGVGLEISELPDPNWLIALQRAAQGGR